jgi:hypothetical protein
LADSKATYAGAKVCLYRVFCCDLFILILLLLPQEWHSPIYKRRARRPLISDIGNAGQRLGGGSDHENTPCELPFKSSLQRPANDETAALLNAYHATKRTSNEIILHTKKLKTTAKTLRFSGMAAYAQGQKECAINGRIDSAQ